MLPKYSSFLIAGKCHLCLDSDQKKKDYKDQVYEELGTWGCLSAHRVCVELQDCHSLLSIWNITVPLVVLAVALRASVNQVPLWLQRYLSKSSSLLLSKFQLHSGLSLLLFSYCSMLPNINFTELQMWYSQWGIDLSKDLRNIRYKFSKSAHWSHPNSFDLKVFYGKWMLDDYLSDSLIL